MLCSFAVDLEVIQQSIVIVRVLIHNSMIPENSSCFGDTLTYLICRSLASKRLCQRVPTTHDSTLISQ